MPPRTRLSVLGGALLALHAQAADLPRPDAQLQQALDALVADVAATHTRLESSLCERYAMVDRHLRPQFDLATAGRYLVLKEDWPDSPAQQQRCVDAFYDYLVVTYGELVVHFDADRLKIHPLDGTPDQNKVWVEGELRLTDPDSEPVTVGFYLYFPAGRWQILDVRADGLLYAASYEAEFRDQIYEEGFEALVARLEERAAARRNC